MVGYEGALLELYSGKINDKQFAEKVAKLETMNTDWFDLLTQDTWSHQHTLSISGGSEQTRYYSSLVTPVTMMSSRVTTTNVIQLP